MYWISKFIYPLATAIPKYCIKNCFGLDDVFDYMMQQSITHVTQEFGNFRKITLFI
eukprot:UN03541